MAGPIVNVNEGTLLGANYLSPNGVEYYRFLGIPYAKPPVGDLRFKAPVPSDPWTGTRDATQFGNISPQLKLPGTRYVGNEDCLFVNVFTPKLNPAVLLPVMIYIHGGAFLVGSSELFDPGNMIEKNVLFASLNYRLGVMGFLCTDAVNARGDMGLRDQNLAMKWLKNNIQNFGGDPNNITIFGESAGSASVEFHLLSDMSKGLFNKAIMESGSAVSPWARTVQPLKMSRRLADKLGYNPDKDGSVYDFLNGFDAEKLVRGADNLLDVGDLQRGQYIAFVPTVNYFKDGKDFLNDDPGAILKRGNFNRVPTITGFCKDEGLFMQFFYRDDQVWADLKNEKFMDYIPSILNRNFPGGAARLNATYPENPNGRNKHGQIFDFLSDVSIIGGALYSISQRLKHSQENLYVYEFTHEGTLGHHPVIYSKDGDRLYGVPHVEEYEYLNAKYNATIPADSQMRNVIVYMWTSFVKTGDPTPSDSMVKWSPTVIDHLHYVRLDVNYTMDNQLETRRALWTDIYSKLD